jgi:hypothetical protein
MQYLRNKNDIRLGRIALSIFGIIFNNFKAF